MAYRLSFPADFLSSKVDFVMNFIVMEMLCIMLMSYGLPTHTLYLHILCTTLQMVLHCRWHVGLYLTCHMAYRVTHTLACTTACQSIFHLLLSTWHLLDIYLTSTRHVTWIPCTTLQMSNLTCHMASALMASALHTTHYTLHCLFDMSHGLHIPCTTRLYLTCHMAVTADYNYFI